MNEKRVKVNVRLPEETKRKALALADHLGISLNAVIALAVRHYIQSATEDAANPELKREPKP